jgi:hypothetical protein
MKRQRVEAPVIDLTSEERSSSSIPLTSDDNFIDTSDDTSIIREFGLDDIYEKLDKIGEDIKEMRRTIEVISSILSGVLSNSGMIPITNKE